MGRPFIVLGDRTDHGGVVVGASGTSETHGKRIARVGDQVTCPKKGHGGTTVIVTGDPTMIIDGQPAARHGDKCACGATLIASQSVSTTSDGGASNPAAASAEQATKAAAAGFAAAPKPDVRITYDEMTKLEVTGDMAMLVGLPWFAKTLSGQTHSGRLDQSGKLPRILTDAEEDYEVFWGDAAIVELGRVKA